MMKKNHITRTIIASAVLFSFNAAAATSYFEARNDAMGGTGVASSHYGVAPLARPGLNVTRRKDIVVFRLVVQQLVPQQTAEEG